MILLKSDKKEWITTILIAIAGFFMFFGPFIFINKGYLGRLSTHIKKFQIEKDINLEQKSESEKSEAGITDEVIEDMSENFITSSFARNEHSINTLLSTDTAYIRSPDGSSFIRYTDGQQHVEGYMATDKNLADYRQRWCYIEGNTALAGVEINLEGSSRPVVWYLHYKKENGQWKLYMLENE